MNETIDTGSATECEKLLTQIGIVRKQMEQVVIGQREVQDQLLCALLAGGHVIVEGVPGLGKTLLVRALAASLSSQFARIQFTPDLMPSDISGHAVYDLNSGAFHVRRGPVFTNLLLADEINRAPAKTQAALLEVMQEGQVTVEGRSEPVPQPFMAVATQNPIEHEGTYPMPEAQLDRFLFKILIEYPALDEEVRMVKEVTTGKPANGFDLSAVKPVLSPEAVLELQSMVSALEVDDAVIEYAARITRATRGWQGISLGAGPRASIALVRAARAHAVMQERDFVVPDDVRAVALPVMRHRVALAPEMTIEGRSIDSVLVALLQQVEAPRA